ncbi:MAG: branched-chain amino acid transport system substrate-binding protein, partial [Gaiellaceae bacterium]|nr:branched-chain amino acid transport system substrate-binding protein [Gaiellaceae bacterium]
MKRSLLVGLAAALATAVTASAALGATRTSSGRRATPGLTNTSITIGGTFPMTGPASLYAPIPRGMATYFNFINARKGPDGKKGVYGRKLVWKYYDDAYNPSQTVQFTHKLVEQDKVFAIVGSLGTEHNLAIRPYLNDRKIPQVLISTGDSAFGLEAKKFPWT